MYSSVQKEMISIINNYPAMMGIVTKTIKNIFLFIGLTCLILYSTPALSCNVPVFRYALERWPADIYKVVVFHRGPLTSDDKSNIDWLEKSSATHIPYSNYTVQTVDISSGISGDLQGIWENLDSPELPCLAVHYPLSTRISQKAWYGNLTYDNVRKLADSPLRQKIAKKILDGDSAVWIFLESGDRTKDDAAADILRTQLKIMENTLTLPEQLSESVYRAGDDAILFPDVHIAFSMFRLSQTDPAESFIISMLMNSEPDLFDYISYPMAFPVYGRGRALYALVGAGINEWNIHNACAFLTGACSCEVKALNPGIDLLMMVDWEAGIEHSWTADLLLPPLVGLSELAYAIEDSLSTGANEQPTADSPYTVNDTDSSAQTVQTVNTDGRESPETLSEYVQNISVHAPDATKTPANSFNESEIAESSTHFLRNILVAFGVITLVITVLSLRIGLRGSEDKR